MNLLGAPSPKESAASTRPPGERVTDKQLRAISREGTAASLREWARSLGREGFRAGVTLLLCVLVIVAGAVVVLLTWARTDVVSVEVSVAVIVLSAWFGLLLVAFGSGMLLGRRVSIVKIVSIVVATGVVALVGAVALRQFDWTIRLTAFWVALLLAIVVAGYLLSDQVGKASVRTFSLLGLVILGLLLITIGRNERVNLAAQAAESAYLQLDQIRDQVGEPTAASDVLVWKLCELGESGDCGEEPEVSGGAELGSCLPGWTYQAFEEWTQAASIDREVAATAALARCELRAFDPGSLADDDPQGDVVPVVESGVEAQADPDAANDIVEAEAQTQAAVDARLAVADAISTQRSRANLIETLADGADGILSSISGPNEFAEFRFSGATWLVVLALGLLWYRLLEIRSGGHGLGPVEIVFEDNPSSGDGSATPAGGDVGALHSSQAVFKQAVVQNVPEPGAVPGAQALAPVGDLISSTDAPNKWVAAGVVDAVRTILATRSGYTVMYSAHQEPNPTRRGDDTAGGSTSVVFVRIRDTQNGAQKASMRFESEYAEEAAQMAGYWVAGWIISRSRYVPEWAVWSERDAHAFYSLQWRQGDDLPLQAHGIVDPNRIQAPVNALILTQRAYAYQISPRVRKHPDSAGPYTFNALEDFARAAYHQRRYPVARYRRAVALSSLMHEGVELDRVFLPRSNDEAAGRPSRTRLLHLFRDLIGYGFTEQADRVRLEGWLEEVERTGVFPVEMRDTMLKLAYGWLVESQQSVRAGFLAQLRPSERRFWHEFSRTGTRQDWTTLVQVSQQIVKVRLNRAGSTCCVDDEMPEDITERAKASDSHWQISYNIGCYYSLRAEQETDDAQKKFFCDRAFDWLERCLDRPYNGQLVREWIERDPDLHAIRVGDPAAFQRWRLRVPRMPVQIRNGDRSSAVKRLQQRLNLVAGPGKRDQLETDGYFGDVTAQAVEEFQYLHDLRVSGKPDLTMLALLETLAEEHGEAIADSPADDEHMAVQR